MAARYNGHKDDDDHYDYSDSFVSDDDDESVKKHPTTRKVAQVTGRRKPPTQKGFRGRMSSRTGTQSQEPKVDNAVQRMLSSKNLRINELKNQLEEFRNTLTEMKEENKLLKKTQKRQEKALNKFENEESDLPQLLQSHNNEVRTLRDQLRKTQEKYSRTDRYLRDAEDELDKTKNKLKKFKNLAEDNNLLERQELQRKVQQTEIDLEERDVKVRDLEKHINHLNKNHRHELGIEIARHRDLQKQLESLRNDNDELQTKLKEKVKAVELANIYSLRKGHKLPASYSGTPNRTPPLALRRKRAPSLHDLTPRDKAKMFEDKRKEDERLQRETGDGLKMAFQSAANSNRSQNKDMPKKQQNLTYRQSKNSSFERKNHDYDSKGYSNEYKASYDNIDDYRTGFNGENYNHNSTNEEQNRNSNEGVFSKPMMFTGSKQNTQNSNQLSHDQKRGTISDTATVFSKPPLFKKGDKYRGFHNQTKKYRKHHREKISANPTFLTESNEHDHYPSNQNSDRSDRRPKQQEQQKREREEHLKHKAEEEERRRQREWDEQEMRDLEQIEQERRHREGRERDEEQRKRDQEAEEWLRKMEIEKKGREAEEQRVREEQQRKEREERERRDRERQEQERRSKDQKERMEMDAQLAEERMKKDELLKKLRLIDEGQNKPEEKKTTGNDLFFVTSNKQRRDSDGGSTSSSKKSYSFTKPIENMHHGKPAREDVTVPYIERQKKQQRDTSPISSYQPSFALSSGITGGSKKTKKSGGDVIFDDYPNENKSKAKTNKKSNLMADLFGDQASKPARSVDVESDDIFKPPVRNTKTTATKTSALPWEDDVQKSTTTNSHKERTSSLFGGGGSGILDDNNSSVFDSSKMLPKRGRQPNTTFQSKPVVHALDHHDDLDIEEIIM